LDAAPLPRFGLLHASKRIGLGPVVDQKLFRHIPEAFSSGSFLKDIPVLIGSTLNEGTLFTRMTFPLYFSETVFSSVIPPVFGSHWPSISKAYPITERGPRDALSEIFGDLYFECAARHIARGLATHGSGTWKYLFNRVPSGGNPDFGVIHGAELAFVFGKPVPGSVIIPSKLDAEEQELANKIADYWTKFAKEGSPGESPEKWSRFTQETEISLVLDVPNISTVSSYKKELCDLWDSVFPEGLQYSDIHDLDHEPLLSTFLNVHLMVLVMKYFKYSISACVGVLLLVVVVGYCLCCKRVAPKAKKD